jgi:hypothetical protein
MTAVQFLENQYNTNGKLTPVDFYQALELEKQQIKNAYNRGYQDATNDYRDMSIFDDSEQYYNENYKPSA